MTDFRNVELCEVVITAPDPDWLFAFTQKLVEARLASSAHNFSPVRSVYRWAGEVHQRMEGRAALHTRRSLVAAIARRAEVEHPYEVPSVSARPIHDGGADYLRWIAAETVQDETR